METPTLDFSATYRLESSPGVAYRVIEHPVEFDYTYELVCTDEECNHEEGWCYIVEESYDINYDMVYVRMVGDDYRHLVDVSELSVISEDDYCGGCGQIGCGW